MAKQHNIKVLLDGQGADEILGGYTKYIHWYLQELISNKKFIKAKKERANFLKNNVQYEWGKKNYLAALLPQNTAIALEKKEYAALINNPYLHTHLLAAIKGNEWQGIYKPTVTKLNDVLYYNTCESGLEELLRYADRNSMANGVEVRLPFLQLELVHFIFALPASLKMANGFTKYILRKTMQNKIPDNILWNPIKTGFETPQKSWMENEKLQALINDAKQTLVNKHYLNPAVMNNKIVPMHAHDAKNMDWRYLSMAGII